MCFCHERVPVEEVGEAVEAALSHSGAQTPVDGGRTLQVHLQPLTQQQQHAVRTFTLDNNYNMDMNKWHKQKLICLHSQYRSLDVRLMLV